MSHDVSVSDWISLALNKLDLNYVHGLMGGGAAVLNDAFH